MAARPGQHRVGRWCLLGVLTAGAAAGCGSAGGVAVNVPTPPAEVGPACATLIRRLPDDLTVTGHRRSTSPPSPYVAAFGEPPVIVRCGGAIPKYSPTADVLVIQGVDWLVLPKTKTTQQFVSFHSTLPVEVTVTLPELPANVLPPVTALITELAPAR